MAKLLILLGKTVKSTSRGPALTEASRRVYHAVSIPSSGGVKKNMTHPDSHTHLHFRTGPKAPAGRRPRRLLRTARKGPGRTLDANPALDPAGGRGHLFAGERGADGRYQVSHSVRPGVCVWDMLMWA